MFRKVVYYQTSNGKLPVSEWLATLDHLIRTRIRARIDRLAGGNAGDYRPVGDGVLEMRLHFWSRVSRLL